MEEYIKKRRKYSHLSIEERGMIDGFLMLGMSISKIAEHLNRSKSTISEEIRRGKYNGKYKAKIANDRSLRRRELSHKHSKWRDQDLLHIIDRCIQKRWPPEIISNILRIEYGIKFSHTSIYTLIKKHRPEWAKYLAMKGKKPQKRYKDK